MATAKARKFSSYCGRGIAYVLCCLTSAAVGQRVEYPSKNNVETERAEWRREPGKNPVISFVSQIEIGMPEQYRGLTIFPLILRRPVAAMNLKTLDEALREGWIEIREKEHAEVPVVLVRNNSRYRVFLMAGEIIVGGKQNRIVRDDGLLRPRSDFVEIPVYYCGECGRWVETRPMFEAAVVVAHPRLRRQVATGKSQSSVWSEFEGHGRALGVDSPTGDYKHSYEEEGVREKLEDYVHHFGSGRTADTVGLVAASHNRILGGDIFSDPELLAKLWQKLLHSYAAEALRFELAENGRKVTCESVRDFLRQVFQADCAEKSSPGEGYLLVLSGSIDGVALVWLDSVVYLALFGEKVAYYPQPRPPWSEPPVPFRRPDGGPEGN
ncbi:MAG: ARPP-1 family domain-containing protein [Kiritimatiellia bacterium]